MTPFDRPADLLFTESTRSNHLSFPDFSILIQACQQPPPSIRIQSAHTADARSPPRKANGETACRNIPERTISSWLTEYRPLTTYARLRASCKKLFPPATILCTRTFHHQQVYRFQVHQAKLELLTSTDEETKDESVE